jgi:hypothetical protein
MLNLRSGRADFAGCRQIQPERRARAVANKNKKRSKRAAVRKLPRFQTLQVLDAARVLDQALQDDLDSIIEVAEGRRRSYLNRLRDALEHEDECAVFFYARRLCGLPEPVTNRPAFRLPSF